MSRRRKRGHAAEIVDFASFILALGALPTTAGGREAGAGEQGLLLFTDSDRPAAIIVRPSGHSAEGPSFAGRVRAALALLTGNGRRTREAAFPVGELQAECRDYLAFADAEDDRQRLLLDPRLEGLFQAKFEGTGSKVFGEALMAAFTAALPADAGGEGFPPEATAFAPRIAVEDPASAHASRFLFPAAFRSGETRFRFMPRSFGAFENSKNAGAGDEDGEYWFRFGVRSPALALGGFWAFRGGEGIPAERLASLTATTAKLAALALSEEFRRAGIEVSVAAAAVARPSFNAQGARSLEGTLSAGYVRFAFRAVVPESYLPALASAFPVTVPAGAAVAVAADLAVAVDLAVAPVPSDPDLAFLVLGRRLRGRLDAAVLEENAEDYPGGEGGDAGGDTGENTGGPVRLVPFHAAFRLLPEDDRRRLAQNFLVREVAADELAELFYFRKTISGEGGSKRAVVRPQAFDLNEFAACLPRTVAETFVASVREGASSATSEDFIRMNERIYKDLAGDLRSGSLALSLRSERLLAEIHLRYVYPRARKRLDGLIEQDQPLAFLRALPPRIFRSLVDRSDAASLAPAFVGREASIEEIARWCSKRKLTYIREEARRLALRLSRGEEYPDVLCGRRDALAALAREITEREQLERGAAEPRRTAEDGGQATRSLRSASAAPLKRGR